MKANRSERRNRAMPLVILGIVVISAIVISIIIGYDKLRDLWLEQSEIRDYNAQVTISSGKMVKEDVVATIFGLRKGANLATIDFAAKRAELLRRVPNLKSVTVTRKLPDRIIISTEEREPIARLGIHGVKQETGKVVDSEGMVFLCQRGTRMLPIIRETRSNATAIGHMLKGRSRAALTLLDTCRGIEFQELGIIDADLYKPDFIVSTLSSSYARAKIAWEDMDEDTPTARASLNRQLTMLLKAIRVGDSAGAIIWNATDYSSTPSRIYADTKGTLQ